MCSLPLGVVSLSLETLSDCKDVLCEFADKLKQYSPRSSKKLGNVLKELKWALKDGSKASIISRLERHKNTLELTLLGLSLYSFRHKFVFPYI
jgi:hypothetical protein